MKPPFPITERHKAYYSVIMWCPFGIPETNGAAAIPIGLIIGLADGSETGIGLIDPASLKPVADALGMGWKGRMGEVDWAFINSIVERKDTPAKAREAFPGVGRHCYQCWYVTEPKFVLITMPVFEKIPVMWTRYGTLPLARMETH